MNDAKHQSDSLHALSSEAEARLYELQLNCGKQVMLMAVKASLNVAIHAT